MIFSRKGKLNFSMRYIFTLLNLVAMLTLVMPLTAQRNAPPLSKTNFTQKGSTSNFAPVCNTAPIDWTTAPDPDNGEAGLYPSVINLSGLGTSITDMSVQLTDVTHTWSSDLEVLLVGPGGQNFIVMADVGGQSGFDATATLTITDSAAATMATTSVAIPTGSYKPTSNGGIAGFPVPAPVGPYNLPAGSGVATFASIYGGTDPNGNWSLYVFDDANGDLGEIAGGWCIDVSTGVIPPTVELAAPTFETDEAGLTSSAAITVERAGDPSAALSVNYSTSDGTAIGGAVCEIVVANDYFSSTGTVTWAAGDATDKEILIPLCADPLLEGNETFNVTLSMPSSGTLGTNTAAVVTIIDSATQYKLIARNEIPAAGGTGTGTSPHAPAGVYPYALNVSGLLGTITAMRVTLFGLSHTFPDDIDMLLVGPTGATFVLMGDAGSGFDMVDATVTFDDTAGTILPNSTIIASGTYEPANYVTPVTDFPAPAPAGPYMEPGSALSSLLGGPTMATTFGGTDPNGTWNLYIRDDAAGDAGGIEGFGLQFAGPTAGQVSISGRAIHASGQGIPNQIITVIGGGLEEPIFTRTNSFGYFSLRELDAGQTYILSIESNKYIFNNPTQVINAGEDVGGIVFSTGKQ